MSQVYLVECGASVCETKRAKDSVTTKLILTKIVEEETQKEILADILKKRGFEEVEGSEGEVLVRKEGEMIQIADLDEMTVTTTVEKEEKIKKSKKIEARRGGLSPGERGYDKETEDRLNEELRQREQEKLEKTLAITEEERAKVEAKLIKEAVAKLAETEEARKEELNDIVKDVYAESLKKKAAAMGNITSIKENKDDQGNYELRIKLTS